MKNPKTYQPRSDARIEAVLWDAEQAEYVDTVYILGLDILQTRADIADSWAVQTLEGWVALPFGHYLIRGTNGEYYPCDPEVFNNRWEEADND